LAQFVVCGISEEGSAQTDGGKLHPIII